ncbi:hypothetical protein V1525DRAFT_435453 [Lipomyces kononenkoae]|uniref:Uncharacterized protein n=1 Tax=Lipomyces kononenkoae TaxID=34357 RepID=A0ACC3STC7_LIPKO
MTEKEASVVQLRTTKDWSRWLAIVRTKAQQEGVWEAINPDVIEPQELIEPPLPGQKNSSDQVADIEELNATELEVFKINRDDWKAKQKVYERKRKAINEIEDQVLRWHQRRTHVRLRPSASQNAKSTRTEEWIAEWESAPAEAKLHDLPDVAGVRPIRQFLHAVQGIHPVFADTWSNQIESIRILQPDKKLEDILPSATQFATIFRNQWRLKQDKRLLLTKEIHKRRSQGDFRPKDWEMRPYPARQVLKGLEKDTELQTRYIQALQEIRMFLEKSHPKESLKEKEKSSEANESVIGTAFVGSFASSLHDYPLCNSWIFDSGSPNHIANKRECFRTGTV